MRALVAFAALLLTGCEDRSGDALKRAEIVERNGNAQATCDAKQEVAAAFLAEKDEPNYRLYKGSADSFCLYHSLRRANGGK